jgi:hypothetical protein
MTEQMTKQTGPATEPATEQTGSQAATDALRDQAVRQLKKEMDFRSHVFIYVMVNGFLVLIWAITGVGFFWPIIPMGIWGVGVAANAWDVYVRQVPSEEAVQREMRRQAQRR